ncbi:amino acid adenylation domain-containing protein [Sphaerisporangium sp. B11E5]|uniref:amino acid adenylation domain-containing protein n=1 Tax=Sphaerisporangium sp. B11E5 TaxID=3153563 RepID=UPI00325ED6CF
MRGTPQRENSNDSLQPAPNGLNDTELVLPKAAGAVGLFEEWVVAAAERVAVVAGGVRWSFGELDAAANRLAWRLREAGVGPGEVVALYADRSALTLAAMLGVLKAGGAYLPLDPGYPAARVELVLADSGARVAVVSGEAREGFPAFGGTVVELEGDCSGYRDDAPPVVVDGADPAYVLYTSGSTGRPKGVVVPHGALLNFLVGMRELLGSGPHDVWLALTSLSFDISGLELYLPLVTGGRTVIADSGTARDGRLLAELVRAEGVTHVQATPSGWRVLLAADYADPSVTALVGGEALTVPLARELRARTRRLINVYGPTETTIWSTAWEVPADPGHISIGRPIANTQVHIVDDRLDPVPPGTPGELLIGGHGLAHGYLNRPDLTAERFVPDPYGRAGGRLYRTGDIARLRPDGTVEYLGRTDNQVKLRGHRIELGEIESVIEDQPGVGQAVAAVHRETLVAYVVGDADPAGLRAALAERLPAYMIPSIFLPLESLPLTPNGKIDRKALPRPELPESGSGEAPRTAAERHVAEVFAEVLELGTVGVRDDFFLLGGHSLLAAKAAARLTARLGVEVPVQALFARPTVAAFAAAVEDLESSSVPLGPRPAGTPPPLSAAQERMWFLHRLDPGDISNVYLAHRLRGPLDQDRLADALTRVVARHEALRTRFPETDGMLLAVVDPPAPYPLERSDLSDLPDGEREAEARRLVTERVNAPFDLAAAPPLRAVLIRLAEREHVLCVVLHHIISDGWSQNVLLADLIAFYEGRELPEQVLNQGDVVHWRRERDAAGGEAAVKFWRERLAGVPALNLPTDHPRSPGSGRRGAFHRATLPAGTVSALESLGRTTGTTLFMVLLAAYQALLARQTGQHDIAVGTAVAGRDRVELESVIGYLAGTVVVRGDLSGDPAFTDLLGTTRDAVLEAFTHQDIPMERLFAGPGGGRDSGPAAVFETMFILHTQVGARGDTLGETTVGVFHADHTPARFDLMVDAWMSDTGLELTFGYDRALFDPETIESFAGRFVRLLDGVVAGPEARLSRLLRVDGAERQRVLHDLNDTATVMPASPGMVELFEHWAAVAPERVAVVAGEARWSYGELNAAANRLAWRLREAGAGPGRLVALYADRSAWTLAGMLAVLKVGAAYLPLDPEYPAARVELVLEDSAARVALVSRGLRERLPSFGGTVLELDADHSGFPAVDPPITVDRADAAYVLYTSGSTGRPKGVVVPHGALLNFLVGMRELLGSGPHDVWLALTSLSFDISGLELYLPLVTGGRTVMADADTARDGRLLAGLVRAEGVTHAQATPSGWRVLLAAGYEDRRLTALVGGEALPLPLARELRAVTGRLVNVYGPTETTIWSTAWEVPAGPDRVCIGRPIANTQVYLVDDHLEPVPQGTPGELLIGGHGLAHGYLHRPDLTATRFVADPYGPPGARLYRTGDIARHRADGTVEYLGRTDNQVKLRGHRIELGEIESVLEDHPDVRQAVVAVHRETLVAYVVGTPDPDHLRAALAERLPAYMIPTLFVPLEALPLTPNGKIDRKALPAPGSRPEVPLRPRAEGTPAPLSPVQEGLWFFHSYRNGDPSAHQSAALRLRGPLDEDALAGALAALTARHEALRTRFPADGGHPRRVIEPAYAPPVARHDLTGLPGAEAEAVRLCDACAAEPFDVSAVPPVRAALIRLAADDHVLCLVAHPLIADEWSLGVLSADLAALYAKEEPRPPAVQDGDVAIWRRRREELSRAALESSCGRLAGAPILELPLDRPRPEEPARTPGAHELRLTAAHAERLAELGRQAGGTLSTTLLAAYQVALARHTGQTGFVVGRPISGREQAELERVVGHLTRYLVIRGDLSGDPAFTDLLRRTRAAEREAEEQQDISVERLVSALQVERDAGQAPLFQTELTLRDASFTLAPPDTFGGLSCAPFAPRPAELVHDLALTAHPEPGGLTLSFTYDTSLLDAATVQRFADRFAVLLDRVAAGPDRRISELPLHTPADEAQLSAWAGLPERLLDPWGGPVPPGAAGELYAPGGEDGEPRRTGERARRHLDGRLEKLGRIEDQAVIGSAAAGPGAVRAYVAPRTDAEALVADVWSDLLGVARVGAFDDFFHLGGHSLLAVRAAARLGALIETEVPIRAFFTHRTLEEFARVVEEILLADLEDLSDEEAMRLLDSTEVP